VKAHIVTLPGDGIGPEVTSEAVRILEAVGKLKGHSFSFAEHLLGGCSIEKHGVALTDETLAACKGSDAVLLGAVGGPKWDNPTAPVRPEQGLLAIRKGLGLYANLRPVRSHPALLDSSPVKADRLRGVNLLVVRELTGGLYFGEPKGRYEENGGIRAVDTMEYHDYEIERIVDLAFHLAATRKKKVTSVDKANVLETSRLWRQIATEEGKNNPAVTLEHMLVDTASMRLITSPAAFDVLVTENTFGDILTDEASVLAGSMGMLPSASLGQDGPGVFEPIHGSAPDIAGKGIANPLGCILSAALLLRYGLQLEEEARLVEGAVDRAISDGLRTTDLGGTLSTRAMSQAVIDRLVQHNSW
jgi:3-isopropylmalate dehydrogenase